MLLLLFIYKDFNILIVVLCCVIILNWNTVFVHFILSPHLEKKRITIVDIIIAYYP